jgi:hypothetical protein
VVKYKVDGVKLAWVEKDGRKMFKASYTRPYGHKWFMHLHARDELEAYLEAVNKLGAEQ